MRSILHSDCNGFFASVECLYHPEFRGKPLAVGGDVDKRHGIILAKNELAKKYKVQTGEAIWQAKSKCPELEVVPPHYDRYKRFSNLCREIYSEYTDRVEPFGLDECWLDVTGSERLFGSGEEIAQTIRKRIKTELGITVSIGVSFNKIFAKLGSDYKKPDAVTIITKENFKEIVWPLPASDLLYVGRSTDKKLKELGIFTIGDIANYPLELLQHNFGKWGDMLYTFSNGLDNDPVKNISEYQKIKSIGNSTTSVRDLKNLDDVKIIFMVLSDSVGRRMREEGFVAREVSIWVRNTDLESFTRQMKLDKYTDITSEILDAAMTLFKRNYTFDKNVRSIGVSVSDFKDATYSEQVSLFDNIEKRKKMKELDLTIDNLKERYGCFVVRPAKLYTDPSLSDFSPKEEKLPHPESYFK